MRKFLLAAVATAAIASPAMARDGSPYVGVDFGILAPRNTNMDVDANFPVTTNPVVPSGVTHYNEGFDVDYKNGFDGDIVGGYDLGMFRIEGEVAYKHASIKDVDFDEPFLFGINGAYGINPALTNDTINMGGHVNVLSGMIKIGRASCRERV